MLRLQKHLLLHFLKTIVKVYEVKNAFYRQLNKLVVSYDSLSNAKVQYSLEGCFINF